MEAKRFCVSTKLCVLVSRVSAAWVDCFFVCVRVCVCASERAPAFIKSVAPALTFTPPPKSAFVVFICFSSDTDGIPSHFCLLRPSPAARLSR